MSKINPIKIWLTAVAYSHSPSKSTEYNYRKNMNDYCKFLGTTPEKILKEYETTDEKTFKRKHSLHIQQYITELINRKMTNSSTRTKIIAVKSFYKYQNLPLGHIPQARQTITYYNRDIETKEIAKIIALSSPREKAFYALMAQSGLRPCVIKQLQIKEVENLDLEQKSYKINIPKNKEKGHAGEHPSFIGKNAKKYLKSYLTTRTNLTPNNLLFCAYKKPNTPINTKNVSRSFQKTAQKLQKTGQLDYEIRKGKPSELRLYTLRKFFKRKCKDMGDEDTNYLMGHIIVGSNKNYRPQNPEYYRKRYEKKALPFLRLESPTALDIDESIQMIKENTQKELATIKKQLNETNNRLNQIINMPIKWGEQPKKETKKQQEEFEKNPPPITPIQKENYIKYLEKELSRARGTLKTMLNIAEKGKDDVPSENATQ